MGRPGIDELTLANVIERVITDQAGPPDSDEAFPVVMTTLELLIARRIARATGDPLHQATALALHLKSVSEIIAFKGEIIYG